MTRDEIVRLPEILRPCQVRGLLNISRRTYSDLVEIGSLRPVKITGMTERRFIKREVLKVIGLTETGPNM